MGLGRGWLESGTVCTNPSALSQHPPHPGLQTEPDLLSGLDGWAQMVTAVRQRQADLVPEVEAYFTRLGWPPAQSTSDGLDPSTPEDGIGGPAFFFDQEGSGWTGPLVPGRPLSDRGFFLCA